MSNSIAHNPPSNHSNTSAASRFVPTLGFDGVMLTDTPVESAIDTYERGVRAWPGSWHKVLCDKTLRDPRDFTSKHAKPAFEHQYQRHPAGMLKAGAHILTGGKVGLIPATAEFVALDIDTCRVCYPAVPGVKYSNPTFECEHADAVFEWLAENAPPLLYTPTRATGARGHAWYYAPPDSAPLGCDSRGRALGKKTFYFSTELGLVLGKAPHTPDVRWSGEIIFSTGYVLIRPGVAQALLDASANERRAEFQLPTPHIPAAEPRRRSTAEAAPKLAADVDVRGDGVVRGFFDSAGDIGEELAMMRAAVYGERNMTLRDALHSYGARYLKNGGDKTIFESVMIARGLEFYGALQDKTDFTGGEAIRCAKNKAQWMLDNHDPSIARDYKSEFTESELQRRRSNGGKKSGRVRRRQNFDVYVAVANCITKGMSDAATVRAVNAIALERGVKPPRIRNPRLRKCCDTHRSEDKRKIGKPLRAAVATLELVRGVRRKYNHLTRCNSYWAGHQMWRHNWYVKLEAIEAMKARRDAKRAAAIAADRAQRRSLAQIAAQNGGQAPLAGLDNPEKTKLAQTWAGPENFVGNSAVAALGMRERDIRLQQTHPGDAVGHNRRGNSRRSSGKSPPAGERYPKKQRSY